MKPVISMFVVDSSVWIARLLPQDRFHQPVRAWMAARRAVNTMLISPALLLSEVAGAISQHTGDFQLANQTLAILQRLPGLRLIEMEHCLMEESARLASLLGLSGTGSIYVAAAEYLSLPLCTVNEDLAHRAVDRISVKLLTAPTL
jgi:predicted nucleic acid-binding protein